MLNRGQRLLLPLLLGMLTIIPPQAYFQAVANGAIEPGYGQFIWRYLSFQPWPTGAFDGSDIGITWNHLWYLAYLLTYTLALIPLTWALKKLPRHTGSSHFWQLLCLPLLLLMLWRAILQPIFGEQTYMLINDGYAHAKFFTFFVLGYLLSSHHTPWELIRYWRKTTLLLAILISGALWRSFYLGQGEAPGFNLHNFLLCSNQWLWILAILGWSYHCLNKPYSWLTSARESVYSWYFFHQTLMLAAMYYLMPYQLPVLVELLLIGLAVCIGCFLFHEYGVKRVSFLRQAFGIQHSRSPRACNHLVS